RRDGIRQRCLASRDTRAAPAGRPPIPRSDVTPGTPGTPSPEGRRDDAHSGSTGDLTSERSVAILSGRACQMAASATVRRRSPVVRVVGYGLSRRRLLPLLGAAAAIGPIARALAANSAADAAEAQASQAGSLPGNPSGSYFYLKISKPSGGAITLTLSYAPYEGGWGKAIGFNAWQGPTQLASANSDGSVSGTASATITPSASGGSVLIQLFNYAPRTINYTFPASGVAGGGAPAPSTAPTAAPAPAPAGARYVYVGTYTKPNTAPGGTAPSEALGVYVFRMDPATGGLTPIQTVTGIPN